TLTALRLPSAARVIAHQVRCFGDERVAQLALPVLLPGVGERLREPPARAEAPATRGHQRDQSRVRRPLAHEVPLLRCEIGLARHGLLPSSTTTSRSSTTISSA